MASSSLPGFMDHDGLPRTSFPTPPHITPGSRDLASAVQDTRGSTASDSVALLPFGASPASRSRSNSRVTPAPEKGSVESTE